MPGPNAAEAEAAGRNPLRGLFASGKTKDCMPSLVRLVAPPLRSQDDILDSELDSAPLPPGSELQGLSFLPPRHRSQAYIGRRCAATVYSSPTMHSSGLQPTLFVRTVSLTTLHGAVGARDLWGDRVQQRASGAAPSSPGKGVSCTAEAHCPTPLPAGGLPCEQRSSCNSERTATSCGPTSDRLRGVKYLPLRRTGMQHPPAPLSSSGRKWLMGTTSMTELLAIRIRGDPGALFGARSSVLLRTLSPTHTGALRLLD